MPSCRILITCIPERQSYNTALDLAGLLAEMGHQITFTGVNSAEQRKHVEANGFAYLGIGPDIEVVQKKFQQGGLIDRIKAIRTATQESNKAIEEFISRHHNSFQLAFMDVLAGGAAAHVLARIRVPTFVFCSGYTSKFSMRYPPVAWCGRTPRNLDNPGLAEKLENLFWWTGTILLESLRWFGSNLLAAGWRHRRQAKQNGWDFCLGDWGIRPRLPEIVCAYKPLDWPVQQRSDTRLYLSRRYLRKDTDDERWQLGIDPRKPLVYCTLGAWIGGRKIWKDQQNKVPLRKLQVPFRDLAIIIDAFRTHPEWQLVIAAGPLAEGIDPNTLPDNVRVLRWVPQDEVLLRSALAIIPGGSATVRDCVRFGVPMLVFPMWTDHFGNAARIAHYKLGHHGGDCRKLTPEKLAALVETLMQDPVVAAAVLEAKQRCETGLKTQAYELGRFVERHTTVIL